MQDKEEIIDDKWDLFTDMDLAEMWFNKEGIDTERTAIDGEWVLMIKIILPYMNGEILRLLLHEKELECKADEWRYENE